MKIVREWSGEDANSGEFDLAIGVLGYETRSTWLLSSKLVRADKYLGLRFGYNEALHYPKALEIYQHLNGVIVECGENPQESIRQSLDNCLSSCGSKPTILIDISAMSRFMMANLLLALRGCVSFDECVIYTHYTPAAYTPGEEAVPVRIAQPVTPELAGWSSRPDAPLGIIAGLGYEGGAAAGALQYLEPSRAWIFWPVGPDERFVDDVQKANASLAGLFDTVSMSYDLTKSVETRSRIASLATELLPDFRVAFVPLGPKLFAWLCTLTALEPRFAETSVWRFSAHELGEPVEKAASGVSIWHAVEVKLQLMN